MSSTHHSLPRRHRSRPGNDRRRIPFVGDVPGRGRREIFGAPPSSFEVLVTNPIRLLGAGTLFVASVAHAQGRAIQLPDTLGANFAIADTATRVGAATDYDALLGFWHFRFQTRRPNGVFDPPFPGHWSFEKKPGGLLIEDRWRGDDPSSPMGEGTYTYRSFDPERKLWRMLGTHSKWGEFALGLTWSDASNRYAIQHYGPAIMRIRYFAIGPDHFFWRADRSTDGGRTWLLDAWTMEAMRFAK